MDPNLPCVWSILDHIRSYNVQMREELKSDVFYLLLSRYISKRNLCFFAHSTDMWQEFAHAEFFSFFFLGGGEGRASLAAIFYNRENIFKTARHVLLKKKEFLLNSVICLFSRRSLARIIRSFNIHMYII